MKLIKKLKLKPFGDSRDGGTVYAKPEPIKEPIPLPIEKPSLDPTNPVPVPKPIVPPREEK